MAEPVRHRQTKEAATTEHWDEQRPSGAVASLQKAGALDARANPVDRLRSEVQPQRKR